MRGPRSGPPKALLDEPDRAYEHYLAEKLGRTVAELRATMEQAEYVSWTRFHLLVGQQEELAARRAGL